MYKFTQEIEKLVKVEILKNGFFLWIWNPDLKSPHLGVSLHGNYTSMQLQSKQENVSIKSVLGLVQRKKNKLLFIELKENVSEESIQKAFSPYVGCLQSNCSCSKPIFDLLGISKENGLLFDILKVMEENNKMMHMYQLNLADDFRGIPDYSYADVQLNLERLTV